MRKANKNVWTNYGMEISKNRYVIYIGTMILIFAMLLLQEISASAQVVYENTNGYEVVIEDDMGLLASEEIVMLQQEMEPITEYGNVAFKSVSSVTPTERFAANYYEGLWGDESGTVFVIDMYNRMIYIYSSGAVYRTITKSYANTITDNVYTYATAGDYYTCASKVYEQIYTLLEGGRVAQPMKYLSNAFLAMIISFVLLYFFVKGISAAKKTSESELLKGLEMSQSIDNMDVKFMNETKTYSPQSSGGGGGSGSRSRSRSSSGGGRSRGGGGGHRF